MSDHDHLCPRHGFPSMGAGCLDCDRIHDGRIDGVRLALSAVDKGGRAEAQLRDLLARLQAEQSEDEA